MNISFGPLNTLIRNAEPQRAPEEPVSQPEDRMGGVPSVRTQDVQVSLPYATRESAPLPLDELKAAHDSAFAQHVEPLFHSLDALGLTGTDVMSQIFSDLIAGDVESALEIFGTLQRVIETSGSTAQVNSGGKAKEDRESVKLGLETSSEEANVMLQKNLEARQEYRQAMRELEAMQAKLEAQMAELEAQMEAMAAELAQAEAQARAQQEKAAALGADLESKTADLQASALEIGASRRDRVRALSELTAPMVPDEAMIAQVEELAARFAASLDNQGYLTREQVDQLAGALYSVPKIHEFRQTFVSDDRVSSLGWQRFPAVQVDPALVEAALRGLASVSDAAAVELMGAQLGVELYSVADAPYLNARVEGHGRDAVEPLMRRSMGSIGRNFPILQFEVPALDAAPVTISDRLQRTTLGNDSFIERETPARLSYNPGDPLRHEARIRPGDEQEFPMTVKGVGYFVSRPAGGEKRDSTYFAFDLSDNGDGTLSVKLREAIDPRQLDFAPPQDLPDVTLDDDGSFVLSREFAPDDRIDAGKQVFAINLGGTRSSYVNRVYAS